MIFFKAASGRGHLLSGRSRVYHVSPDDAGTARARGSKKLYYSNVEALVFPVGGQVHLVKQPGPEN